ncbi:hypothetical protein [Bradyrhizobium sp. HKCCYLS20291]|uniref:hypothetical protein n=1 Tax=Bradyrhizobium sp. HKCCYLS20291 TaxID=3420766 RepID=UPI003EBA7C0B
MLATITTRRIGVTRLDTSVGVSGPCDFTSAPSRSSAHHKDTLRLHRGHRFPTSRVVTIARYALCNEAGYGTRA